jgi:hypothetical protein
MTDPIEAALDAMTRECRYIQGFHYRPFYVIRDVLRRPADQELARWPDSIGDDEFQRHCDLARMARAIAAYEAARWQDIASAPTDGTPILVGCARTKSLRWAVWSDGYWRDGQAHAGGEICGCPEPTHWQPLPAAPKGE